MLFKGATVNVDVNSRALRSNLDTVFISGCVPEGYGNLAKSGQVKVVIEICELRKNARDMFRGPVIIHCLILRRTYVKFFQIS